MHSSVSHDQLVQALQRIVPVLDREWDTDQARHTCASSVKHAKTPSHSNTHS